MISIDRTITIIKNNPIGFIGGTIAGYYVAGKYAKVDKTWQKLAIAFIGGIVGTGLEHKITSMSGLEKTKAEIKK